MKTNKELADSPILYDALQKAERMVEDSLRAYEKKPYNQFKNPRKHEKVITNYLKQVKNLIREKYKDSNRHFSLTVEWEAVRVLLWRLPR